MTDASRRSHPIVITVRRQTVSGSEYTDDGLAVMGTAIDVSRTRRQVSHWILTLDTLIKVESTLTAAIYEVVAASHNAFANVFGVPARTIDGLQKVAQIMKQRAWLDVVLECDDVT